MFSRGAMRGAAMRAGLRAGARPAMPWCWAAPGARHNSTGFEDDEMLAHELEGSLASHVDVAGAAGTPELTLTERLAAEQSDVEITLEQLPRPPAKFDLLSNTSVFKWQTTARHARRITGPMNEWGEEMQCRTGVHVDMDATYPERVASADYASADDVDCTVFFFGAEKAVREAVPLLKAMLKLDPCYVRVAVFRRTQSAGLEWLTLRRINREARPADIPPVSLKTPGKYTMLFENVDEAATRTAYEETGIELSRAAMVKTNVFTAAPIEYYWRPPVHYFVAELPEGAEVLGPQAARRQYMSDWDPRLLRQSTDPIDRVWASHADPKTGCAWLSAPVIDELQLPVKKQEQYMSMRYAVPPESRFHDVVKF